MFSIRRNLRRVGHTPLSVGHSGIRTGECVQNTRIRQSIESGTHKTVARVESVVEIEEGAERVRGERLDDQEQHI